MGRRRRTSHFIAAACLLAAAPACAAEGRDLLPATLLELCAAPDLAGAVVKADTLGWSRLGGDRLETWRSAFLKNQGGTAEAAAWRRGDAEEDDAFAFWIVRGDHHYNACAFTTRHGSDLLRALRESFGVPRDLTEAAQMTIATWRVARREISYSRIDATVLVEIVTDR